MSFQDYVSQLDDRIQSALGAVDDYDYTPPEVGKAVAEWRVDDRLVRAEQVGTVQVKFLMQADSDDEAGLLGEPDDLTSPQIAKRAEEIVAFLKGPS